MEEAKIIYKRNSAWWIATCYLLGTLFFLIFLIISIIWSVTNIGKDTVIAINDLAKKTEIRDAISSRIRENIKLISYDVETEKDSLHISISIKNESKQAINHVKIEVTSLDNSGSPINTIDKNLFDVRTIFPGDIANSRIKIPIKPYDVGSTYSLRISDYNVIIDYVLKELCEK